MSFPRANRDFDDAKAEGVLAEWLLLDLLAERAGFTVIPYQANWDLAAEGSAAKAYGPDGPIHLPDLEVAAPIRLGFECKSKQARRKDGSFGWDATAFGRAERWQETCRVRHRAPCVIYGNRVFISHNLHRKARRAIGWREITTLDAIRAATHGVIEAAERERNRQKARRYRAKRAGPTVPQPSSMPSRPRTPDPFGMEDLANDFFDFE